MSSAIAFAQIYNVDAGGQFTFTIPGLVGPYCLALAGVWFNYGDDDNNIFDMSVSVGGVTCTKNSTTNTTTISGTLYGKLEDDSGHTGTVSAQVVLIAVLDGAATFAPVLANTASFNSGSNSSGIQGVSGTVTTMLSGFSMGYSGDHDQGVNQISAVVSLGDQGATETTLTGTCVLAESTKTKADNLTLAGALLSDPNNPSLFEIISVRATSSSATSVKFTNRVSSAQAILTGFNAQYSGSDVHKVEQLVVSYSYFWSPNPSTIGLQSDGQTFKFYSPQPHMVDDENNNQSDNLSYADYVVIGVIEQPDSSS